MDRKKIIKNIAAGIGCLSLPALIYLNFYQHRQIKKLSDVAVQETSEDKSQAEKATSVKGSPVDQKAVQPTITVGKSKTSGNPEADELNYQLSAAHEELDAVNKQLADEKARKVGQKKAQEELQKRYAKDIKDSSSRKNLIKNSLGIEYGDLFKELNLPSEKLEKFKDILVDQMIAQQNIFSDFGDTTNLSKAQQEEINQRFQALEKEYDAKKSELLGNDGYEKYQSYTERSGERYYVNNFIGSLGSDEKLTDAQKTQLIDSIHDEVKNVSYERITDDNSESSSNRYDEKSIALMLKNEEKRDEAYLKAAQNILSASQLEKFKTSLKQERDKFESIMKLQALRQSTSSNENSSDSKSD
jgi:hypothetical protein